MLGLVIPASAGYAGTSTSTAKVLLWLVQLPLLTVVAAYALQRLSMSRGIAVYGLGAIVGGALNDPAWLRSGLANEWKYLLGYPVTALVLAYASRLRMRSILILGLLLSGAAFAAHARSLALTLLLAIFTSFAIGEGFWRHAIVWRNVARILAVALVCSVLVGAAMATGQLGSGLQKKYSEQTANGKNLFIGGRTETFATAELARLRPQGYGIGILPSATYQAAAVNAVARAGGYTGTYYTDTVFHGRVDLHSGVANLWYHFGIGGLALAAVLLTIFLRGLGSLGKVPRAQRACAAFIIWFGVWDLLASPISNFPEICAAAAVSLGVVQFIGDDSVVSGSRRLD